MLSDGYITITNKANRNSKIVEIKTVESGKLQGKRIVSFLGDNKKTYLGFAFVGYNGQINIWKRFQQSKFHITIVDMILYPERWQDKAEYAYSTLDPVKSTPPVKIDMEQLRQRQEESNQLAEAEELEYAEQPKPSLIDSCLPGRFTEEQPQQDNQLQHVVDEVGF